MESLVLLLPVAGSGRRCKKEKTGPTEEKEKLTAGAVGVAEEGRLAGRRMKGWSAHGGDDRREEVMMVVVAEATVERERRERAGCRNWAGNAGFRPT
ncbi:hypothetical protein D5086_014159 [Populus alba]|uniref:Uncharacterized protein n=1 Tax=Populus alba TaxID=43335 RepID=A0ACC4C8C2_POPAL